MSPGRAWLLSAAIVSLSACATEDVAPGRSNTEAASVNLQLAVEYMKLDNLPVAREKMERALKQDPQNAIVQSTAGVLYERLGNDSLAEKHYAAGARLGRKDPNVQNTYAGFLCRKGRNAEGETVELELILLPLTAADCGTRRLLGAFAIVDEPYWIGVRPIRSLHAGPMQPVGPSRGVRCGCRISRAEPPGCGEGPKTPARHAIPGVPWQYRPLCV